MQVSHIDDVLITPGICFRQRCDVRSSPTLLGITNVGASERIESTRYAACECYGITQNVAHKMPFDRGMPVGLIIRHLSEVTDCRPCRRTRWDSPGGAAAGGCRQTRI